MTDHKKLTCYTCQVVTVRDPIPLEQLAAAKESGGWPTDFKAGRFFTTEGFPQWACSRECEAAAKDIAPPAPTEG